MSGHPTLAVVVVDYLLDDLVGRFIHKIAGRRGNVLDTSSRDVHAQRWGSSGSACSSASRSGNSCAGHIAATARAYRWSNDLLAGRTRSIGDIARREHLTSRHVRRVMRLAFLAPRIVEAIAEGRQSAELSTIAMTQRIELPPLWSAQQQALEAR
ncbi:MAG: hypothetical protein ACLQU2_01005 [Candidatus Binataceae bacterium]